MEKYENPLLQPEERAADLIQRMTLKEKISQLGCALLVKNGKEDVKEKVKTGLGSVAVMDAGNTPEEASEMLNEIQKEAVKHSRFHIPVLFHAEALTGPLVPETATFPLPITNAATFHDENIRKMAEISKKQLKNMGIRLALSPVLDISRDFRYGRTGETYGSDETLVSKMGVAFVRGMQGDDLKDGVASTAKHFLGCAQPEAGINQTRAVVDGRELDEVIAKPFEAVIHKVGIKAIMNTYGEVNGQPVCGSEEYLKKYLKNTLGFEGAVVSDYHSLERLMYPFKVAENEVQTAAKTLRAGMDMEFPELYIYDHLEEALDQGLIDREEIDQAVLKVLKLKFELGIYDNPYSKYDEKMFRTAEEENLVEKATEEAITLLKNENVLPLKDKKMKIGVIGQSADSLRHMYGAYTAPATTEMFIRLMNEENAVGMAGVRVSKENHRKIQISEINQLIRQQYPNAITVKEALEEIYPNIQYAEGFRIGGAQEQPDFEEAKQLAESSDVLIVCVGGKNGVGKECTSGEGVDTSVIELSNNQEEYVKKLYAINPNIIIVHMDSRPLVSPFIYEHIPAIIEAWLPCTYGGKAVASVIAGKVSPSGHLPVDIPKSTGQTPYYYGQRRGSSMASIRGCKGDFVINKDGYINEYRVAQRPFGYGLSYTKFEYSNMKMTVKTNDDYTVETDVENTGNYDGGDVVQLYGSDVCASVIRPEKILLGFHHVFLNKGEKKTIQLNGNLNQFAFADCDGNYFVERGKFIFEISEDSETPILTEEYDLKADMPVERNKRCFYAESCEME